MNRTTGLLLGAAAALTCAWTLSAKDFGDLKGSAIEWRQDLKAARAEAKKADKPLLVVFRCVP